MSDKLDRFVNLMKGIFELDKSDLDFGIYRIMNIRKAEIEKFLSEGLPAKINETLAPFAQTDTEDLKKQIAAIEKQAADFGIADISASPMAEKYNSLKAQLAGGTDLSALESDVYSALYNFFNRYYDEGDFISKRRYKEGVYAIPYEGEEVKLYWANQDQYYVKTSENFKDYTFKADDYLIHFRIVDATTEQNNNKESDDSKRVFMLFTEDEENFPGIKTFEHNAETSEIIIRFVYDIPEDKKRKYAEENYNAVHDFIYKNNSTIPVWQTLLAPIPTGKGKETTTLLEKHMKAYVAKNTFDYFIHKDLKGFLSRELDFYIKSEIMHLDDLDTTNEQRVETYLAKVRAVKRVGHIIIDFLSQIENFQKKLWLKKKFVIETNWCITLDRIDERFYPEIIANKAQIQEWIDMYAVDEIKGDMLTEGFTNPPTAEFLKQNDKLIVDTKHFSSDFKERLIASIDNLDEQTGGLMINSDNYQALNFMSDKYSEQIKLIYIDPPYNTDASKILYKNGYEHSSWISLMESRLKKGREFLSRNGIIDVAIDDYEMRYLNLCLDQVFGIENAISNIAIMTNPKGRDQGFIAQSHDYTLMYAKNKAYAETNNFILSDEELAKKFSKTKDGEALRELPLKRTGTGKRREERPYMYFPFFYCEESNDLIVIPEIYYHKIYDADTQTFNDSFLNQVIEEYKLKGYTAILPLSSKGELFRWRWGYKSCVKGVENGTLFCKPVKSGGYAMYQYDFADNEATPKSLWMGEKYDASSKGTNLLESMIPNNPFDFPKSLFTVMDNIIVGSNENDIVMDYFAGSGTTGHAVMELNRSNDESNRRYILVEMGSYFNSVTKPRVIQSVYSSDWKDGKPQSRNTGVSHIMKYMKLESYEDALSNITLDDEKHGLASLFGDDYLINYMLDIEAEGSLLNLDAFRTPFEYKLKVTENNETKEKNVDVVETFNYLIGLTVQTASAITYFDAVKDENGEYEGAVRLVKDIGGTYGFKQIEGTTPDGKRVLVIWRTISDNLIESNAALDAYFSKHRINPQDREYDIIYVNGDNNLQNISTAEDTFKVQMTELEFKKRMFEEE